MNAPVKQTTVLSTKGQVILPKAVRDRLRWEPGARLVVEEKDGEIVIRRERPFPPTTIDEVFGMLKYDGPPISIEQMNAAAPRGMAEDDARIMEDYRRGRDRD